MTLNDFRRHKTAKDLILQLEVLISFSMGFENDWIEVSWSTRTIALNRNNLLNLAPCLLAHLLKNFDVHNTH